MDELNRIFQKYEFGKSQDVNSELINQVEQFIGFTLPPDYKFYLQNFEEFEGFIGSGYVALWDLKSLLDNNTGYLIKEALPSFLGIGSNRGGELLTLEYLEENAYRVALVPFIGMEKDVAIEIGISFTDFLVRLDNEQDWFS